MRKSFGLLQSPPRLAKLLRRHSIRSRLLIMTAIQVALAVALIFYIFFISVQNEITSVSARNIHTLEMTSLKLQTRMETLYSVTKYPITQITGRTFIYEYLSALDRGQLNLRPDWSYEKYFGNVVSYSKTMFALYPDSVQQIRVYQPNGAGIQSLSSRDLPKGNYSDNHTLQASGKSWKLWMNALDQEQGAMLLLPQSLSEDAGTFPSRDASLYAGRAIIDSGNRHVLGYVIVRSDISDLIGILTADASAAEQTYGLFDGEGRQLFGNFPKERADRLIPGLISKQKRTSSFDMTFQTDSISVPELNGYFNCSYMNDEHGSYVLVMEVPKREIILRTLQKQIPLLFLLLLFFFLLVFFSYQISYSITSPLKKLQSACRGIQKNGRCTEDITDTGSDELASFTASFNTMARKINQLIHEEYEKDLLYNQLELQMLHMQINPHFLYNTLESIHAAAYLKGEEDLSRMAVLLGKTLRYGISAPADRVCVKDEVENLMNYIHLQKLRYKERISFFINIDESILECHMLKVILQPIVENAIYHGIDELKEGGAIQILGYRKEDVLMFQVVDNGRGLPEEKLRDLNEYVNGRNRKFESIGLKNVNRRIQLCYGASYGLKIVSAPGRGTMVTIRIPSVYPDPGGKAVEAEERRKPGV